MHTDMAVINFEEPRRRIRVIAAPSGFDLDLDRGSRIAPSGAEPTTGPPARINPQLDPGQQRMLAALEQVFPVRFESAGPVELHSADAVLALGPASLPTALADLPRLMLPSSAPRRDSGDMRQGGAYEPVAGTHRSVAGTHAEVADTHRPIVAGALTTVLLSNESALAQPLRGRAIAESAPAGELALMPAGATVLASVDGEPVWWEIGKDATALAASAYPLPGLYDGEALREHLRAGRFMGLLALVHFLERVLGKDGWRPPPLRASFIVDDPNLHWPSYGFLKYHELAEHAVRHGYHMGLATVPLDGWLADRRVTSLLARNAAVLSLLMHGNNHVASELGNPNTDVEASPPIAQALRRIAAMERRHGVTVERVMIPPYEDCSQAALRAMFRLGIDAACHTLPYPWRQGLPAATPLAGWHPAEMVAGGLPVLPRYPLGAPVEELALRALLGQPLILYGHHEDFAQGLDILAQATHEIGGLGEVQWGSLGWIARGNYATRRLDGTLLVKMHARRISVDVPAGVRELRMLVQEPFGGAAGHCLTHAAGRVGILFEDGVGTTESIAVDGPTRIDLTLTADRPLDPTAVPSPGVSLWPLLRRAMAEGRDRIQALR